VWGRPGGVSRQREDRGRVCQCAGEFDHAERPTALPAYGSSVPGKQVELVRGRLFVHEPPGFMHGVVVQRIGFAIGLHLHPNGSAASGREKRGTAGAVWGERRAGERVRHDPDPWEPMKSDHW